jgi:ABC-2 type transport system ATP-binding protein
MLTIEHFKKYFGENKAVNDVSFTINPGEIFCLIGPNSAGKSTLVKSIVGLLEPTSGTITIDGHDNVQNPEEAKRVIGYIPDEPAIWSHMTGEEFLYFTQALYGEEEKARRARVKELLSIFALEGIEKNNFEDYSRGNKQKFSILAALSHKPKVLLIDEPIVGLDPIGAEIAKKLFVDFARGGGAVLLVTHTLPVAEEISTKIGFLKQGTLSASGTLTELRTQAGLPENASLEAVYKKLVS